MKNARVIFSLAALLTGCSLLFPQGPTERNPFVTLDSLSVDTSKAMFLYYANQHLEAPETYFDAITGTPFYFHSTKFSIDGNLILWVDDIPVARLAPMKRVFCEGYSFLMNNSSLPGRDYSKDYTDGTLQSRFRLRLESLSPPDTLKLAMSWVQLVP